MPRSLTIKDILNSERQHRQLHLLEVLHTMCSSFLLNAKNELSESRLYLRCFRMLAAGMIVQALLSLDLRICQVFKEALHLLLRFLFFQLSKSLPPILVLVWIFW